MIIAIDEHNKRYTCVYSTKVNYLRTIPLQSQHSVGGDYKTSTMKSA